MKTKIIFAAFVLTVIWAVPVLMAEHGGTSMEHGGMKTAEPSAGKIRSAMKNYVDTTTKEKGAFEIYDTEAGKTRKLGLVKIHQRVGKAGDYYYTCADFKDTETNEMLDLDIDVRNEEGKLNVADVTIHKVNGKERYTYDAHSNRIPVKK